jgi:hypothetical protein
MELIIATAVRISYPTYVLLIKLLRATWPAHLLYCMANIHPTYFLTELYVYRFYSVSSPALHRDNFCKIFEFRVSRGFQNSCFCAQRGLLETIRYNQPSVFVWYISVRFSQWNCLIAANVEIAPARSCLAFPRYWHVGEVVAWERRTLHLEYRTQYRSLEIEPNHRASRTVT